MSTSEDTKKRVTDRLRTVMLVAWYPSAVFGLIAPVADAFGERMTFQMFFWSLFLILYHTVLFVEGIHTFRHNEIYSFKAFTRDLVDVAVILVAPVWLGVSLGGRYEHLSLFYVIMAIAFFVPVIFRERHVGPASINGFLDDLCALGILLLILGMAGWPSTLVLVGIWALFLLYLTAVGYRLTKPGAA